MRVRHLLLFVLVAGWASGCGVRLERASDAGRAEARADRIAADSLLAADSTGIALAEDEGPAQIQSAVGAGNVPTGVVSGAAQGVPVDASRLGALREVERGPVAADLLDSDAFLRAASTPSTVPADADARAAALLAQMTLEEKVGQMTQVTLEVIADKSERPYLIDRAKLRRAIEDYHIGSVLNVVDEAYTVEEWRSITGAIDSLSRATRLGVPVLYGVDAVHGANYTVDAALFPQNIGLAATFNPALVQAAAAVTARDVRAGGVPWDFAPVLDIGRHLAWSRFYETFGEDPHVASVMGVAQVRGYEGTNLDAGTSVAATAKHFVGYSGPRTGRDRSSAFITERELCELYLPPYQAAIDAGRPHRDDQLRRHQRRPGPREPPAPDRASCAARWASRASP